MCVRFGVFLSHQKMLMIKSAVINKTRKEQQSMNGSGIKQCVMCSRLARPLSLIGSSERGRVEKDPAGCAFLKTRGDYKSGFMSAALRARPDMRADTRR